MNKTHKTKSETTNNARPQDETACNNAELLTWEIQLWSVFTWCLYQKACGQLNCLDIFITFSDKVYKRYLL